LILIKKPSLKERLPSQIKFLAESATGQTSKESKISNSMLARGAHHGDIRKSLLFIGISGLCCFGCHDLMLFVGM